MRTRPPATILNFDPDDPKIRFTIELLQYIVFMNIGALYLYAVTVARVEKKIVALLAPVSA